MRDITGGTEVLATSAEEEELRRLGERAQRGDGDRRIEAERRAGIARRAAILKSARESSA